MKAKPTRSVTPASPLSMDWPRETGLADEFLAQVEAKLRQRAKRRKRAIGTATSVSLVLLIIFWLVPTLRYTGATTTLSAQRQTLVLADGSRAELNARTALHTDFRYGRRVVRLDQGEAFFSVAKDSAHPFLVETPACTVQVTGTQFNVRLSGSQLEVTLLEGSVKVGPVGHLSPGQQFDSDGSVRSLSTGELGRVTAWRTGQIVLDGLTLAEAAARLGEFHGVTFSVSPEVATLKPGGTFPLEDLPGFLEALETALPVQVTVRSDGFYAISARVERP